MTLLERYRAGDVRALARLISLVENGDPAAGPALSALAGHPRPARVIGLTGPPGAGKSSLAAALVAHWRGLGRRVALLAVDPSSARSGGAALGDRLRLAGFAADAGVFIRSMATRGSLGGLAAAAGQAVALLAGFGFDIVLVETVGVGQAEIDVARLADVVVVVQVPGLGDEMQAIKAGVLEIADLIVVNKADLPGAAAVAAHLRALAAPADGPPPPVLLVSATRGDGIAALASAIEGHARPVPEARAAARQIVEAALARLRPRLAASPALASLVAEVQAGRLSLEEAGRQLAEQISS